MNGHDAMLDDVAVYALGTLAPADAERVRRHIQDCAQCRAEYELLAPAVTAVAFSSEACVDGTRGPVPSALLKARIMREVRSQSAAASKSASTAAPAQRVEMRRRPLVWPAYAVAAAAMLIALITSVADISLNTDVKQGQLQVAVLENRATLLARDNAQRQQMLNDVLAADSVHFNVPNGQVIKHGGRLYIAYSNVAQPAHGRVYQAWTQKVGAKVMSPSVTFTPNRNGVVIVPLPVDATTVAAVAVSNEPEGGSRQPTTTPYFLVKLS